MKYLFSASMFLLLLPTVAFGAGFAKQSLFLSKSPVTEGDRVHMYTIIANDSSAKFTGTVTFKDGDTKISATAVSIDAGGTQTASAPWIPTAGDHKVTAELSTSGTVVEQEAVVFSIAAKPKPVINIPVATTTPSTSLGQSAAVESSQGIQNQIGSLSPTAESAVSPVFGFIDSLRARAASLIDSQLTNTKQSLAKNATPSSNVWFILWTLYLYVLTLLQFLINNAGVFYPALAAIFFFFLWRMYRRFRR